MSITIPPIIRVANAKNLFDSHDDRKIHKGTIPPLGGVAIFIGFILSTIVSTDGYSFDALKYIIAAVMLMFFIGLKDDLLVISARKKFIVQIFAAVLLTVLGDVHFTNLHGMFGLYEVYHFTGVLLTLFVMIAIINAFNLIDGIDGLASGLAILASTVFGVWFYLAGHIQFSIMSFALTGSLIGFFIFNVFGKKHKMFMGDTGSLVVGLVVSTLVIKFNEFNIIKTTSFAVGAAPAVSFAVIIVPLLDVLRVMTIRVLEGRSPFSPDTNHVHHRLLKLIPGHFKVTMTIVMANAVIVGFALGLNHLSYNITIQFLLIFLLGVVFSLIPSVILRLKKSERKSKRSIFAGTISLVTRR